MIFLRPAPAAKTRPVAASCVASSHAGSGASTPVEYHQELGWLPVSVLAGVGSGVVHTNCGYLRLCMHKLQQSSSVMSAVPGQPSAVIASTKASTWGWQSEALSSMRRSPPMSVRLSRENDVSAPFPPIPRSAPMSVRLSRENDVSKSVVVDLDVSSHRLQRVKQCEVCCICITDRQVSGGDRTVFSIFKSMVGRP
jgi:hypothetical protein